MTHYTDSAGSPISRSTMDILPEAWRVDVQATWQCPGVIGSTLPLYSVCWRRLSDQQDTPVINTGIDVKYMTNILCIYTIWYIYIYTYIIYIVLIHYSSIRSPELLSIFFWYSLFFKPRCLFFCIAENWGMRMLSWNSWDRFGTLGVDICTFFV